MKERIYVILKSEKALTLKYLMKGTDMKIKIKKIGMRTLKTALAVILTLFICDLLNITNPFFATIAAIIAMETSVSGSLLIARERMYGTVIGAAIALLFTLLFPVNYITIGLGVLLVIYICDVFQWQNTIKISNIVFIAILLGFEESGQVEYAVFRTLDTLLGLTVGTLVNYFVYPNKVELSLNKTMDDLVQLVHKMVGLFDTHESVSDLNRMREELRKMESQFDLIKREMKVNRAFDLDTTDVQLIFLEFEKIYSHLTILDDLQHELALENSSQSQIVEAFHLERIQKHIEHIIVLKEKLGH